MTEKAKSKKEFRNTKEWKEFRNKLKEDRKVDGLTGRPLRKGFHCHHIDMREENYTNLIPENFEVLNKTSHKIVHEIFRYKEWRDVLKRLEKLLSEMELLNT